MIKLTTTTIERSESWQIKRLLALARNSDEHGAFLPEGFTSRAELARHLSAVCKDSEQSGEALLWTTCARQTPLPVLQGIKELAKSLAARSTTESERAAATLLYHAAIAAALGRHGQNISSRPGSSRYDLYEDLGAFMAGDPLGQVFQEAAERLAAELPSGKLPEMA